jgi:hypothetical protein
LYYLHSCLGDKAVVYVFSNEFCGKKKKRRRKRKKESGEERVVG